MSKVARRRAWPIHGYVGPNGGGKSAAMVADTLPSLVAGRRVLSTVRILDFENPRPCEGFRLQDGEQVECEICLSGLLGPEAPQAYLRDRVTGDEVDFYPHSQAHPLWVPFTSWTQLLEAHHTDVLMDEVTGVASSRESQGMPAAVVNALLQMRRADVVIRWSAPSWARADKVIRETSQAVTHCVGFFPKRHGSGDRQWRVRRLARWMTYDATQFEDFTVGKREQLRPMCRDFCWLPRSGLFNAYDSFDAVLTIGTVAQGGTCDRCGGTRRRPQCKCPDHAREPAEPATGGRRRADVPHDTPTRVLAPVASR